MDIFSGWENCVERLREKLAGGCGSAGYRVLAGTPLGDEAGGLQCGFCVPSESSGRKLLLKGNHDYWWTTMAKMNAYLAANGFDSLSFLHNNCVFAEGLALCGTRSWLFDAGQPHDER